MQILNCTKPDFDQILNNFEKFWGVDDNDRLIRLKILHHPMFIYELGDNAFVIKEDNKVVAYLFGVFSTTEPLAYVHFIATRQDCKRRGLATGLYNYFMDKARRNGCEYIKAITLVSNETSCKFHKSLGMSLIGEPNDEGIPVVADYAGPGQDRVVFLKKL